MPQPTDNRLGLDDATQRRLAAHLVGLGHLTGTLEPWRDCSARSTLRRWLGTSSRARTPSLAVAMEIAWWAAGELAGQREPVCQYDAWRALTWLAGWRLDE